METIFRCKVVDTDETHFYIDYPVNAKSGKVIDFGADKEIKISYVKKILCLNLQRK